MNKIIRTFHLLFHNQKGQSLLIVAFSMVMMIGFTAIVVDAGSLYLEKSRLQKALDAAVLGGAQALKISKNEAKAIAKNLANDNGYTVSDGEMNIGENFIEITKIANKNLTFARVLGINQAEVPAYAKATLSSNLLEAEGVIPVGVLDNDYIKGATYALNETPGEGNNGNYNFLAIDGKGANVLGDGIKNGSEKTVVVGKKVLTEPGMNWGKVREAFKARINGGQTEDCPEHITSVSSNKRVVILPLIDSFKVNGRKEVTVVGFAAFWIKSIEDKKINGCFIETIAQGEFGEGEDFGIYGVKLVK